MMDDPTLAWPAWKFGLKSEDLFSTLADRYNTFTSPIQDPESFHHDVWEISNEASSTEDFHRLLAERKQSRLKQLDESLQAAAFEIIGNPKLISHDRWAFAVHLFQTRSLDSMIQYFWSYIPDHISSSSSPRSSFDDCSSTKTTSTQSTSIDDASSFLGDHERDGLTHEPLSFKSTGIYYATEPDSGSLPGSCPSLFEDADPSNYSPANIEVMSFSGSEEEHFTPEHLSRSFFAEEKRPQPGRQEDTDKSTSFCPTASEETRREHTASREDYTRCSGLQDDYSAGRTTSDADEAAAGLRCDDDDELPCAQFPDDGLASLHSDTPTPKQHVGDAESQHYFNHETAQNKASFSASIRRHTSPGRNGNKTRGFRRSGSPLQGIKRSPEGPLNRVQKPLPDPIRRPMVSRKARVQ